MENTTTPAPTPRSTAVLSPAGLEQRSMDSQSGPKSFPLNSILILITFLSLLLTVFFIYQNWQLNQKLQQLISAQQVITPTPTPTLSPTPTCRPRPACLDMTPACKLPETPDMCPKSSVSDQPVIVKPAPYSTINSPVTISGKIPKSWTFEANFIIEIQNDKRIPLNSTPVYAKFANETDEIATFTTSITFSANSSTGFVIIKSDNPSGLPENQKTLEIPIRFK